MRSRHAFGRQLTVVCLALASGSAAIVARQGPPAVANPAFSPSTTAEIKKGAGFILGRVVDAAGDRPVRGAIVSLVAQAVAGNGPNPQPSPPRRALTDANGQFLFRDLAGGRFTLTATAPGCVPGGYLQPRPESTPRTLELGADERRGDIQIALWKYAAINGTVVDETDAPAVGAYVFPFRRALSGGRLRWMQAGQTTTDDRGVYRLSTLTPGDYLVGILSSSSTIPVAVSEALTGRGSPAGGSIRAELYDAGVGSLVATGIRVGDLVLQTGSNIAGYAIPAPRDDGTLRAYRTVLYPSAPTPLQATVITLRSGDDRAGVDLSLRLLPAVRVTGAITGPDGPGKNVSVKLLAAGGEEFDQERLGTAASTISDDTGAFTFLGVLPGQYTLKILKTGAAASTQPALWTSQLLNVGASDLSGVTATLRPGVGMAGRVEFVGAAAKPAPADLARIGITMAALSGRASGSSPTLRVGADQQFASSGYPPGTYLIEITNVPAGWTLRSIAHGTRGLADEQIALESDAVTGLVITFTDQVAELSGQVTGTSSTGAAESDVVIFPADSQTWKQGAITARRVRATTTIKGAFAITGVPPGQYFVAAVAGGGSTEWFDPEVLEGLEPLATRVTIAEGEKKSVALRIVRPR